MLNIFSQFGFTWEQIWTLKRRRWRHFVFWLLRLSRSLFLCSLLHVKFHHGYGICTCRCTIFTYNKKTCKYQYSRLSEAFVHWMVSLHKTITIKQNICMPRRSSWYKNYVSKTLKKAIWFWLELRLWLIHNLKSYYKSSHQKQN